MGKDVSLGFRREAQVAQQEQSALHKRRWRLGRPRRRFRQRDDELERPGRQRGSLQERALPVRVRRDVDEELHQRQTPRRVPLARRRGRRDACR